MGPAFAGKPDTARTVSHLRSPSHRALTSVGLGEWKGGIARRVRTDDVLAGGGARRGCPCRSRSALAGVVVTSQYEKEVLQESGNSTSEPLGATMLLRGACLHQPPDPLSSTTERRARATARLLRRSACTRFDLIRTVFERASVPWAHVISSLHLAPHCAGIIHPFPPRLRSSEWRPTLSSEHGRL